MNQHESLPAHAPEHKQAERKENDPNIQRILDAHLPEYDGYIEASRNFVTDTLGIKGATAIDRVSVLPHSVKTQWGVDSAGGSYLPEADIMYLFEPESQGRPKTEKLQLASSLVHEFTHSALETAETATNTHPFYSEGIAGMAEYFALKNLAEAGEYTPPPDAVIKREIDGESFELLVPSEFRRVDAAETIEDKADSTQALLAAMVIDAGLNLTGRKASEILKRINKGESAIYSELQDAIAAIDPILVDEIEKADSSTDGIIKIAVKAQESIEKQRHVNS